MTAWVIPVTSSRLGINPVGSVQSISIEPAPNNFSKSLKNGSDSFRAEDSIIHKTNETCLLAYLRRYGDGLNL